eukprot:TRINITY_DN15503_c0_g1_i3.p2 TRINITY_DN15503_c0_g1~~TRINITY_DN15503_c0_g1_i3.p2  ORF type:complete len:288 (-),score=19.14 TRINITY_DN15503_c0_g1_i3:654-1517(-)
MRFQSFVLGAFRTRKFYCKLSRKFTTNFLIFPPQFSRLELYNELLLLLPFFSFSQLVTQFDPKSPAIIFSLQSLEASLKRAYKLVTEGKFSNALDTFNQMLLMVPMLVVDSRKEVDEVKELITICKEYHIGLRCELKKKEVASDQKKVAELAAYFTHCNLQPVHLMLSLRAAMTVFFKIKNYATCQTFCRRLLELNPGEKFSQQARQVLAACEKSPQDTIELDYDARNPFDICSITFTPIYRGSKYVEDPFTGARFQQSCEGQLSPLGNIVKIGSDASGLRCSAVQR